MIGFGVSANSPSSSLLLKEKIQKSFRIQTISFFATFLCSQLWELDSCSWSSLNLEVVPVLESLIRDLIQVVKVLWNVLHVVRPAEIGYPAVVVMPEIGPSRAMISKVVHSSLASKIPVEAPGDEWRGGPVIPPGQRVPRLARHLPVAKHVPGAGVEEVILVLVPGVEVVLR